MQLIHLKIFQLNFFLNFDKVLLVSFLTSQQQKKGKEKIIKLLH